MPISRSTTPPRPTLPWRTRHLPHRSAPFWAPPGGWARPTPAVLRAIEEALAVRAV